MATTGLYSQHVNNKKARYLRNTLLVAFLLLLAVACLFPLFYMIANSFGPAVEAAGSSRSILPSSWSLDSYKAFFDFSKYSSRWLWNSLVVAVFQVIGNVLFASMAGYAFAKKRFPLKEAIFWLYLATLMMPGQVILIPVFTIMKGMGLLNTYPALFLVILDAFGVFLMRQFMEGIPDELLEAARIDGCGELGIFCRVVLPLSRPVVVSLVVAGATMAFVFPFVLYCFLQKEFVEGIALSGIKG